MTAEQLERANEIFEKLKKLRKFQRAFDNKNESNNLIAHCYWESWGARTEDRQCLGLNDYPELDQMISNCISNWIKELEKQLEEI